MFRFIFLSLISVVGLSGINGFVVPSKPTFCTQLHGQKEGVKQNQQKAYAVGTLIEFTEKRRVHTARITKVEHKSNGGARYDVEDHDGRKFQIADKAVNYAMIISPTDAKNIKQIFDDFSEALEEPETELGTDLDISLYLLEMAWEAALEEDSHQITPNSLIELVHSHAASPMEEYKAWRLLRGGMSHIFFKEIKDHGRVVAFEAKTKKIVQATKESFCSNEDNENDEFCWV